MIELPHIIYEDDFGNLSKEWNELYEQKRYTLCLETDDNLQIKGFSYTNLVTKKELDKNKILNFLK